jgi:hypothetical protein
MPSVENSKEEIVQEIFSSLADAIKRGLQSEDSRWAEVALKFIKQNGEVSQLPVPGSKVAEIRDSLPFKIKQA